VLRSHLHAAAAGLIAAGVITGPTAIAAEPAAANVCRTVEIPVAMSAADTASQTVSGLYCTPAQPAAAADVLVPGATYENAYWNWPVDPSTYSYTERALRAGQAVLAIDRLGTGASSYPPSDTITASVSAYALHQVIAWVRRLGYRQVNVIGHSLGSIVAALDAAQWPRDPSRLVLTAALHVASANALAVFGDFYPAADDPQFALAGYDPGYVTTLPGMRGSLFYYQGNQQVISYDEAHKDVVSMTELQTGLGDFLVPPGPSNPTDQITAPVLLMVGQDDYFFCQSSGSAPCGSLAALYTEETPYYTSAKSLTIRVIPLTGHDLTTAPTAPRSFAMISSWLATTPPGE
jgi:pimeloyl-ACP methyl ester carboxylesterase